MILQDEAVMRIAQTTSMNLEWSRKFVSTATLSSSFLSLPFLPPFSPPTYMIPILYICSIELYSLFLCRCLVENEWDFNKAVTAFTLLNVSPTCTEQFLSPLLNITVYYAITIYRARERYLRKLSSELS